MDLSTLEKAGIRVRQIGRPRGNGIARSMRRSFAGKDVRLRAPMEPYTRYDLVGKDDIRDILNGLSGP